MTTKASTKYTVLVNDEALEGSFTKKAKAVEAAETAAKANKRAHVTVQTGAGNVVHEIKGVKTIRMSPAYTRVVDLPEGAIIPSEMRVAYIRARKSLAIAHHFTAPEGPYAVVRWTDGKVLAEGLPTTRSAGAFCKTVEQPVKA